MPSIRLSSRGHQADGEAVGRAPGPVPLVVMDSSDLRVLSSWLQGGREVCVSVAYIDSSTSAASAARGAAIGRGIAVNSAAARRRLSLYAIHAAIANPTDAGPYAHTAQTSSHGSSRFSEPGASNAMKDRPATASQGSRDARVTACDSNSHVASLRSWKRNTAAHHTPRRSRVLGRPGPSA